MKQNLKFETEDRFSIVSEEGNLVESSILLYKPLNKSAYDHILGEGQSDLAINSGVS